jgi:hypothetical protein
MVLKNAIAPVFALLCENPIARRDMSASSREINFTPQSLNPFKRVKCYTHAAF